MRCDQHMGLNQWAQELIAGCGKLHFCGKFETKTVAVTLPVEIGDGIVVQLTDVHGTRDFEVPVLEPCVRSEPSGEEYSGFDSYELMKYTLRNGDVYYEFEQAAPWSSGPVFFLALRSEDGTVVRESLWTDEEIEKAL